MSLTKTRRYKHLSYFTLVMFLMINVPAYSEYWNWNAENIYGSGTGRIQDFSFGDASYTDNGYLNYLVANYVFDNQVANVKDPRYGAVGDNTTDDRTKIQTAVDSGAKRIFIPDNTFYVSGTIYLNDDQMLWFASRKATIRGNFGGALIAGKNAATTRLYNIAIHSGTLDGTSRSNAGSIGIDAYNISMLKVFGTAIKNVETAVRHTAPGSGGCFYNDYFGVDINTVVTGYKNTTLANHLNVFGGRVNDTTTGTYDDNNTGNSYYGLAVEVFTTGHQVSESNASQFIRFFGSRLENLPTSGTGILIGATAQDTLIVGPQFVSLTTDINDSGLRTNVVGASEYFKIAGGTRVKKHQSVSQEINFPSIAANSANDNLVTISGALATDSVFVTPPASIEGGLICGGIPASGGVYVRCANVTTGAINPASATFIIDIWRH